MHVEDSKDEKIYHLLVEIDTAKYMLANDGLRFKIKIHQLEDGLYQLEVREIQPKETK